MTQIIFPEDSFLQVLGSVVSAIGGTLSLALLYFRIQSGAYITAWYAAVGMFSVLASIRSGKRVLLIFFVVAGLLANVGCVIQSLRSFDVAAMDKGNRILAAVLLPIGYLTLLTVPIVALSERLKVLWYPNQYSNV